MATINSKKLETTAKLIATVIEEQKIELYELQHLYRKLEEQLELKAKN